jgi:hypothetical protein
MASFDFITDAEFRAALESDYRELNTAMDAGLWKAVHILAGSIYRSCAH